MKHFFGRIFFLGCVALALMACVRKANDSIVPNSVPTATPPTARAAMADSAPPAPAAAATAPVQPPSPPAPSYEVAIATAVSKHEHSLDACKALPETGRKACIREADSAYVGAKTQADKDRAE